MTAQEHTAMHDYFREQGYGPEYTKEPGKPPKPNYSKAQQKWAKLSDAERKAMVMEGMRKANIPEELISKHIDDIMKDATPGIKTATEQGKRPAIKKKNVVSREVIEEARERAAKVAKEAAEKAAKGGLKQGAKSTCGRILRKTPIGLIVFLWDWAKGGPVYACEEAVWPVPDAVRNASPPKGGTMDTITPEQMRNLGPGPSGFGGFCFVRGTLVHTLLGLRPIETLRCGDIVLSWNEEARQFEHKKVLRLIRNQRNELVDLRGQDWTVTCSAEHPFLLKSYVWKRADELFVGDGLLTINSDSQVLSTTVRECSTPVEVFNITVEDNHTYCITESGIVVHNK